MWKDISLSESYVNSSHSTRTQSAIHMTGNMKRSDCFILNVHRLFLTSPVFDISALMNYLKCFGQVSLQALCKRSTGIPST